MLQDKVAIVTGASEGIGETIALGLAREGASVVVADIQDGSRVVDQITSDGGSSIFVECDVTSEEACSKLAEQTYDRYGKIDILVSNAALFSRLKHRPFEEIPVEEWDRVMAVNVRGVWFSVKAVVPYMRRQRAGSIINVTTDRVYTGIPWMLHYDASKGAVSSMIRVMAVELGGDNIRVNGIAPGLTDTANVRQREGIEERHKMIIEGRALKDTLTPQDMVGAVVFLASGQSRMVTGQTIVVDGGTVFK